MLAQHHIDFIHNNLNKSIAEVLFKGIPFDDLDNSFIAQQIQARQQIGKKLPSWVAQHNIVFPPKLNLAQSSSEITANFKSSIISASEIADLTGGFGIDTFALAKTNKQVWYIEKNENLVELVKHNASVFELKNISFNITTAEDYLVRLNKKVQWIFIDPSRRDISKNKVFLFEDCTPNILELLPLVKKKCNYLLMKTSPLIDISYGIKALKYVKNIYVIAVGNDLKELLWELDFSTKNEHPTIKTVQFKHDEVSIFDIDSTVGASKIAYSLPLQYIYEPNVALMKVGRFYELAEQFQLKKLHPNSHLFTSTEQILDFPGRSFQVQNVELYKPKVLKKKWKAHKMNISTRNFPIVAKDLIKLLKTVDGGKNYVFFTTDINHQKIVISCSKLV